MNRPKLVSPHNPFLTPGDVPEWAQAIAESLLRTLRQRDPYTYGHCMRVARHAKLLARAAGLNEYRQRIVEYASMFHDLGKLGIPDSILLKEGPLSDAEEAIMRSHPARSVEVMEPLSLIPFFKDLIPGIHCHHERMDGEGYPHGTKGEHIPIEARVILIADTFDAMTTTRPYRKGLPAEIAYKELKLFADRQFDRHLVNIFVKAHPTWGELDLEITEEYVADQEQKTKKAA